jgi:putative transposase
VKKHQTYHTDLVFRLQLGILPDVVKVKIPASTLSHWRKRDLSRIIGADQAITDENLSLMKAFIASKKLMQAAKAIWIIYKFMHTILTQVKGFNKILRKNKEVIVTTVQSVSHALGIKRACRLIGISTHQFHAWRNARNCRTSFLHNCRRKQPYQLTSPEVKSIQHYFSLPQYLYWSGASIYYQMLRDKASSMNLSTFYKYASLLQLSRKLPSRQKHLHYKPIRATSPIQILQMDVTIFKPLDHTRVYIYMVVDNFSRAVLSATASLEYSSKVALENLQNACFKYSLLGKSITLITDGGSENKGMVNEFIQSNSWINQLIAQTDIRSSNSMIEAVNKRLKYDFLYAHPPPDFPSTVTALEIMVDQYMNKPLHSLHGLTPIEVVTGKLPDKIWLAIQIAKAKRERIAHNQNSDCGLCLIPENE